MGGRWIRDRTHRVRYSKRMRISACAGGFVIAAMFVGCFRFTEDPMRTVTADSGADSTVVEDTGTEVAVDAAPTLCDRNGGYPVVQKAMGDLVTKLKADCRVDRYFLSMAPDRLQHMQECMALQLGWIMRCPGVKYPAADSKGAECRDVRKSHQALGIHNEDFDGMLDDILAVLTDAKIAPADLASIMDALKIQRTDIVNPGDAGRGDACVSETAADAGVDTGEEY
jgi:hypothetical protein